MNYLYNIFIFIYSLGIRITSLWSKKAKDWVNGRKNWKALLKEKIKPEDQVIWMHCASAGEFEQGKPVLERLKVIYPDHKLLVSFFSPSGYKVAIKYTYADAITYLPIDTKSNAKEFLQITHPRLVIFVKYEFWFHYLSQVARKQIPLLLISAVFRNNQVFFKPYGGYYRQMLSFFDHLFVQDALSLELLRSHHINKATISGDTRFDRVLRIAGDFTDIPAIKEFLHDHQVIVAGSTWPDDEKLLAGALKNFRQLKLILAPHEIHQEHILSIRQLFPSAVLFSELAGKEQRRTAQVLVIDNVGMLSRLYKYATITYIGGGYTKDGIHNTLEAAVFYKPVIFGPNYHKYREAKELIASGGAFSIADEALLASCMQELLTNRGLYENAARAAGNYVEENGGATEKIIQFIQANRLLTR